MNYVVCMRISIIINVQICEQTMSTNTDRIICITGILFNAKIFLGKQMQRVPVLQFFRSEVLGRQQQLQQQKSYKRHSDDDTVFLRLDSALKATCSTCMHTYANMTRTATGIALELFVLYNSFPWLQLLPASNSRCCITLTYSIQPSLTSVGFPSG